MGSNARFFTYRPLIDLLWETPQVGPLFHDEGVADAAVRFNIAATNYATHTWSSDNPVRLEAGNGLQFDHVLVPDSAEELLTIGYSLHTPTS